MTRREESIFLMAINIIVYVGRRILIDVFYFPIYGFEKIAEMNHAGHFQASRQNTILIILIFCTETTAYSCISFGYVASHNSDQIT